MYELLTLGQRHLRRMAGAGEPSVATSLLQRPKHFALLTYLALQNGHLCRRDTLLALFWPESDEARARNALSKMLGRIRAALGDHVVHALGAHEVGLHPDVVRIDVDQFRNAVRAGDWVRALGLYGGDFLDGFHLRATPAFESWSDEMRGQLRAEARVAAQRLADEQERAGHIGAAVASLRRAIKVAPSDEAVVRKMMLLLQRSGERAAALTAFRELEGALSAELGAAPEEETRALAQRIRRSSSVRSVAVLPWANLTGDADQDHISNGLTDLVITELARTADARITSRQSSLYLRGSSISLAEIGRLLVVDAIVEGSVTRLGNWLTVTAQLIRLEPEEHLWAQRYDAALGDLPDIAARIAGAVAGCLRGENSPRLAAARPVTERAIDPAAVEAYLRGRHFSVILPRIGEAIVAYRDAVERAPTFAPAWAGLASAYATLTLLAHASPAELFPPFRHAVERAVRLDPMLGEAHSCLGFYRMLAERDWHGADEALRVGAELATGAAEPHIHRATYLAAMGRFQEARAEASRGLELDPLGPAAHFCSAWCDYKAHAHAESNRRLRELLNLHPNFAIAYTYLAVNHALLGEPTDAASAAWQGIHLLPHNPEALALGIAALARSGHATEASEPLAALLALRDEQYLDPWSVGIAFAGLGDVDEVLRWFRRMYEERSPSAFCIAHDPLLDPLRDEPRFRDLVRRLAFPSPARHAPVLPSP